jgi:tetratricopeptide (TPR) repeat protein
MDDPRALEKAAFELSRLQDYMGAAAVWERLLGVYDRWENGYAHYYLADCYTRIGRLDDAENAYLRAIQLSPHDDMFTEALTSLRAARAAGHVG